MKNIYTSNFLRHGNNPLAIAISLTVPTWYEGERITILAPSREMIGTVKKNPKNYNQRSYTRNYLDLLQAREVDPQKIIDSIPDDTILLCYEQPGYFCHRRIFAEWIERKIGFVIPEWENEQELIISKQKKNIDSLLNF